jgi:hypothetical protein
MDECSADGFELETFRKHYQKAHDAAVVLVEGQHVAWTNC